MTLPAIDHVIYATGIAADFQSIPAIQPMLREHGMKTVGGLPCLTHDLMWKEDIPMFFTGRLAGLRLGPWAANLEGARQGAERVAWKVAELIEQHRAYQMPDQDSGFESGGTDDELDARRVGLGLRNQFELLGLSELVDMA